MLATHPEGLTLETAPWIDLFDPTDDERRKVEEATGLTVPTRAALSEIESTSRAYQRDDALYFSTSLAIGERGKSELTPIGFIFCAKRLITVRFAELETFAGVGSSCQAKAPKSDAPAEDMFLRMIEAIVDRGADHLEALAAALTVTSRQAFAANERVGSSGDAMKAALTDLGGIADNLSQLRDSLHGVARVVNALGERYKDHLTEGGLGRIPPILLDLKSLDEYREQLWTKVQFTLDATLGFVNIEQNEIVKTLTVVSTVGVPPVLIAGIYGMNFKYMPELSWHYGYPFALVLIVLSALIPLKLLKSRGWI